MIANLFACLVFFSWAGFIAGVLFVRAMTRDLIIEPAWIGTVLWLALVVSFVTGVAFLDIYWRGIHMTAVA